MTGRDLIIYILENGLEDEPVVKDGKLIGFMSVADVAVAMEVSYPTVLVWVNQGMLDSVHFDNKINIPISSFQSLLDKKERKE